MNRYETWKDAVAAELVAGGWSPRGVFRALRDYDARRCFMRGDDPIAFARRIDRDAPLGAASPPMG